MPGKRFASPEEAMEVIRRCDGTVSGKQIATYRRTPGLRVLAAIDFLVNYLGYTWSKNG